MSLVKIAILPPITECNDSALMQRMNTDIGELNRLISDYNETEFSQKQEPLRRLLSAQKHLDDEYSDSEIIATPQYQERQDTLFRAIQIQTKALKLPESPHNLLATLEAFDPSLLATLTQILSQGEAYSFESEHSPEITSFKENYSISYIGGKNSKNFLTVHLDNRDSFILKADESMNSSHRNIARRLREAQANTPQASPILIEQYFDKRVTYQDPATNSMKTKTLCVQAYYTEGKTLPSIPNQPTLAAQMHQAINIAIAQIKFCRTLHKHGVTNTDFKGNNLFFSSDHNGELCVSMADSKAFVPIDHNGFIVDKTGEKKPINKCIHTPFSSAPEFSQRTTSRAERLEIWAIGNNTKNYLQSLHSTNMPISPESQARYQQLTEYLQTMTKNYPKDRPAMNDAMKHFLCFKYECLSEEQFNACKRTTQMAIPNISKPYQPIFGEHLKTFLTLQKRDEMKLAGMEESDLLALGELIQTRYVRMNAILQSMATNQDTLEANIQKLVEFTTTMDPPNPTVEYREILHTMNQTTIPPAISENVDKDNTEEEEEDWGTEFH